MTAAILIKPHHFVDIIRALGDGQEQFTPHPYGHNVHGVAAEVLANRNGLLQMELGADDICSPCVHNRDGLCDDAIDTSFRPAAPPSKRAWNLLIDRRWCEKPNLGGGDRLTGQQFCERLRELAGDLTDIYREEPPERTAARAASVRRGVDRYLDPAIG
jgi:hypothetical protein